METTQTAVHPLMKSYTLISSKHLDYNNLSAFESVALAVTLMLTVTAGSALSYIAFI